MIRPFISIARDQGEAANAIARGEADFVLTSVNAVEAFAALRPISAYRVLPPYKGRGKWLALLAYVEPQGWRSLISAKRSFPIGGDDLRLLYGLSRTGDFGGLPVRFSEGAESALLIPGDAMLRRLGSRIRMNFGLAAQDAIGRISVTVALNGEKIAEIKPDEAGLQSKSFSVPPNVWRNGENVLTVRSERDGGAEIAGPERLLAFNWISIALGQPAAP
jgi:hypothetical protein